jgi:hypothetical protein
MSKYRAFMTPDEQGEFDLVVEAQEKCRAKLRELRRDYQRLLFRGRDRSAAGKAKP